MPIEEPQKRVPGHIQFAMGQELAEACDRILSKYGCEPPRHAVPLLAGTLFGQALRYGWKWTELAKYCLTAFEEMARARKAQTTEGAPR